MTITKVEEQWAGRTDKTRVFVVESDNVADGPVVARAAAGIPALGSAYPGDATGLLCDSVDVTDSRGPMLFRVEARYTQPQPGGSGGAGTGGEDVEIHVGWISSTEPLERDIDGNRVANSFGTLFDPPPQEDIYDLLITITRTETDFTAAKALTYRNVVNSDSNPKFWGFHPGQCRSFPVEAVRLIAGKYRVTYRIGIREAVDAPTALTVWHRRILDRGFYAQDDDGNEYRILDDHGQEKTEPSLLDGFGKVSAVEYWHYFRRFKPVLFAPLNLPTP